MNYPQEIEMEFLSSLLVGNPLIILAVAGLFAAAYILIRGSRFGKVRRPRSLLVPAGAWAFYAAWEWLVLIRTPEANIRVDLLVIWPVLLIISVWFAVRAFRRMD
jgi:hypothetical protein